MSRTRISTTVDGDLLTAVRERRPGATDSSVLEEALGALLADLRRSEVDRAYREAYERVPFEEPDAWGDLASFGAAADRV
jgi:hypothetical protein